MQQYRKRDDGVGINKFYCDHKYCMRRKIVLYHPYEHGVKPVGDWGMIYFEYPDGTKEIQATLCPYHYERYNY